jgi:nucleotide-binding universal stress UspA family protein
MSGGLPGLILCAWDMRPSSDRALLTADALARRLSARLGLVHVIPHAIAETEITAILRRGFDKLPSPLRRAADAAAEHASRLTSRPGESLPVWVGAGPPGSLIVAAQVGAAADLVVMAASGDESPAGSLGSVALEVLTNSPRPVLAVRAADRAGPVLVASDLSDPAYPAIAAGAVLAKGLGAELSVLHVVDPAPKESLGRPRPPGDDRGDAPAAGIERHGSARDTLVSAMTTLRVRGQAIVVAGPPAETVLGAARSRDARTVVVGIDAATRAHESRRGDTVDQILRTAPCSVMAVRLTESRRRT